MYKDNFVKAYIYNFRSTKKEALQAFKTTDRKYQNAIIESFKHDARSAFNDD